MCFTCDNIYILVCNMYAYIYQKCNEKCQCEAFAGCKKNDQKWALINNQNNSILKPPSIFAK